MWLLATAEIMAIKVTLLQIKVDCSIFRTPHKQDGETQHFDHLERSKLEQPILILNLI